VEHTREQYRSFLGQLPANSQIALEAGGHYYWLVDEIQRAGHQAKLANPVEAKKRMGRVGKKTDKIDAEGLAILLRNGTLPTVWIPPGELRDQRELLRLRMFLVGQGSQAEGRRGRERRKRWTRVVHWAGLLGRIGELMHNSRFIFQIRIYGATGEMATLDGTPKYWY